MGLINTWEKPLLIPDAHLIFKYLTDDQIIPLARDHHALVAEIRENEVNVLTAVKQTNYTIPYIYFDINKYPVEENPLH